jgi:hypothetical protein
MVDAGKYLALPVNAQSYEAGYNGPNREIENLAGPDEAAAAWFEMAQNDLLARYRQNRDQFAAETPPAS